MAKPLSDEETHERLERAREALGLDEASTPWAETALTTARNALSLISLGLIKAMSRED